MKNQNLIRKLTAWTVCLAMTVSLFAVAAFAAGPYTGTESCPCGGTARWMSPGGSNITYVHNVNGADCTYTHFVGYQGLVCQSCGRLLKEVPVDYEYGHTCI